MRHFALYLTVMFLLMGQSSGLVCDTCSTLEELVQHLKKRMTKKFTHVYKGADDDVLTAWQQVTDEMLKGQCSAGLPDALSSVGYEREQFADATSNQVFCVLAGTSNDLNTAAWGTVIVNQMRGVKPLSIDIPHPLHDISTPEQGIAVFRGTSAHVYTLSGSHRNTNGKLPNCEENSADAAHTVNTFHVSSVAVKNHYEDLDQRHTSIQFHGMKDSSCPGVSVYLTHGSIRPARQGELITQLADKVKQLAVQQIAIAGAVVVPGMGPFCKFHAETNTQGRMLNEVHPQLVCSKKADSYTGRFIHIEQKGVFREPESDAMWITAINSLNYNQIAEPAGYKLTKPEEGQNLYRGTTHSFEWDEIDVNGPVTVSLNIGITKKHKANLVKNFVGTSSDLTIPTWIEESDDYSVCLSNKNTPVIRDCFGPFIVTNPLTLLSPKGGEVFQKGLFGLITFKAINVEKVELSLHKGQSKSYYKPIANEGIIDQNGDGLWIWKIPTNVETGSLYSVRIRSAVNVERFSPFFTIQ